MPYRVLPNDVVECDTIEELQKLQSRRRLPQKSRTQNDHDERPAAKDIQLTDLAKGMLSAMLQSGQGLNTDELTKTLGIEPKSLPPVLRSLRKWCQEKKLDFEGVIEKRPAYLNKRYVTVYSLTDHGRVTFAGMAGLLEAVNGRGAPVNHGN